MFKIGQVATLAGVSVRTLHHYDDIGLVRPSARSQAGHRLYTRTDLERLQHVMFFREMGLALEAIARALDDPAFDRRAALTRHRTMLVERAKATEALLALVDRALEEIEGDAMSEDQMFAGFEKEAEERWCDTGAWAEHRRRTKDYGPDDWARIKEDARAIEQAFADAMADGVPATDPRATALAERHRLHIDRWFYACSPAMHAGLGEMYVADPRFAAHYEAIRPGLATYIRDAIARSP